MLFILNILFITFFYLIIYKYTLNRSSVIGVKVTAIAYATLFICGKINIKLGGDEASTIMLLLALK
jgi:hypothetical protein